MNKDEFLTNKHKIFYGEMYGRSKTYPDSSFIALKKEEVKFINDGMYYIWSWRSHDATFYKWKDYGDTWAFTLDELKSN